MNPKNYIRYSGQKVILTRHEDTDIHDDGTPRDASNFTAVDAVTGDKVELEREEELELRHEWRNIKDEF